MFITPLLDIKIPSRVTTRPVKPHWKNTDAEQERRFNWLLAHVNNANDSCLTWPFTKSTRGYASIYVNGCGAYGHRVMCELAHGPAPSAKHVAAHSCGKGHKACVNPRHVRWATKKEDAADRKIHGTQFHPPRKSPKPQAEGATL